MLPEAHLTLHSRMSDPMGVITLSWLSGSWRSFLYSSSAYSCHLFLISSAPFRFIPFLSYIFAWNILLVSLIFLKRSLVFPILLFSSISLNWLLRKAFLSLIAILWISAFRWIYLFRVPEELWMEVCNIVQEAVIKTITKKKKCKQAKCLSEEALQKAEKRREVKGKGEKERYIYLNAEFKE